MVVKSHLFKETQYQVNDNGQHDADDEEGDDGEIEGEIVLLYEDVTREPAQKGDMLAEDQ